MATAEMHAATTSSKYELLVIDEVYEDKMPSAARNRTAILFAYISTAFAIGFSLGILMGQKTTFLSKGWYGLPCKSTYLFLSTIM